MIYEPQSNALVVVPNELRDAINAKLDAAIVEQPGAAADREYLYNCLLGFYAEYGCLPEFELAKREES